MLAQLYVDMHEEHHAERIWREEREIVILRFGKVSKASKTIVFKTHIVYVPLGRSSRASPVLVGFPHWLPVEISNGHFASQRTEWHIGTSLVTSPT